MKGILVLTILLASGAGAQEFKMDFDGAGAMAVPVLAVRRAASVCDGRASVPGPDIGEVAHGKGLLWEIRSPSGGVSYILGTQHTDDAAVIDLLRRARPFFEASRGVVSELDMSDRGGADYQAGMVLPGGRRLSRMLPPELYRRASALLPDYGAAEESADLMKVWALFSVLSRPPQKGGIILDKLLYEEAQRRKMPLSALETIPELIAALDSVPLPHQIESLKDAVCDRGQNEVDAQRLSSLYLQQNIGGMYAYSFHRLPRDHRHVDAFMEAMLFGRSARMAERLSPALEAGGVFVGLGAMHLPGPRGLLLLLEGRGFTVSPVDLDDPSRRPAAPPPAPQRTERAGPGAPALENDIPELLTPEQAARIWEFVKTLAQAPASLPPPRIRFETFDPQRAGLDTLAWIDDWGKAHPDVVLPFPKTMQGYYFEGTGLAQIAPGVFRRHYQTDPATGLKRDFVGLGYYSLGHEMLHYAFEQKGVPIAGHHCAFLEGGGNSLSERLAAFLSDAGLSSMLFIQRDAISAERRLSSCPAAP
jgi:uncharacterized protein YbaP (TraB family)